MEISNLQSPKVLNFSLEQAHMDINYFGEPNWGNVERASSSRKGKKKSSEKPKQPQRGLGVAQLEKIRLHAQIATSGYQCSPSLQAPAYSSNFNINDEDPQVQVAYSSPSYSSSYGFQSHNNMMGIQEYDKTNLRYGDSLPTNYTARWENVNAIMENQSSAQELDLELRLSL